MCIRDRFYDEECQNTIHEYQNDKGNYTAVYNALLHSHDLIARTSDRFYNVITNEMTLQKTQMDANQHVTFVGTIILLLIVLCWLFYFCLLYTSGDKLTLTCEVTKERMGIVFVNAVATVDDEVAVSGELMFALDEA